MLQNTLCKNGKVWNYTKENVECRKKAPLVWFVTLVYDHSWLVTSSSTFI